MLTPALLLTLLAGSGTDRVELESGRVLEGRVVFENASEVVVDLGARERTLAADDVRSISSVERSLVDLFARLDAASDPSPDQLVDHARFAAERGLAGEARLLALRALTLDPEHEAAWGALGGESSRRHGWRADFDGARPSTLGDLREREGEWRRALEIPTAHFDLRTDLGLERATAVALDLERAYLEFYATLGQELGLFTFDERPRVFVYSMGDDFPEPLLDGRNAWYTSIDNVLYVNADAAEVADAREAMRHFVELMVFTSFKRTHGRDGKPSPFVSRALGELYASALDQSGPGLRLDFGRPDAKHFRRHATSSEPYSLSAVIDQSELDTLTGDSARLLVSQSYSLLHFLLHADGGAYRAGAMRFLESSFNGQASHGHFERELGLELEVLEAKWSDYVTRIAETL